MKKYLFVLSALALSLSAMPASLANGGPYAVDDAGIATPGKFKLESWSSFANNGDRVWLASPGFTLEALPFVEFELTVESRRTDGEWGDHFRACGQDCPARY